MYTVMLQIVWLCHSVTINIRENIIIFVGTFFFHVMLALQSCCAVCLVCRCVLYERPV